KDERFGSDPYVKLHAPLSVLCSPIVHQGQAIGVLYLENNLVRDAFTPNRAEVVRILASQAAISLQNARLYEELEQRVERRTNELSVANARLQQEIVEHTRTEGELQKAKEVAEAANRAKSEFLANMSHELRTPLNGILGYAQILKRDDRLTDSQRSGLDTIESSGEHLLTLITDILDLSKIEAGKMEEEPVEFNLREFLENIQNVVRIRAEQKGLAFLFEPHTAMPIVVKGDERRLRQVLLNLLGNAVKFTEQGGVALKVSYGSPRADTLRIEIEDTGVGIAEEQMAAIFEPFHQIHARDRKSEGTGLGLSISRKLVRLLGGSLEVDSTVGKGSTFIVELSLPEIATFGGILGPNRRIVGFEGPARTIMVVDDKEANRAVLCDLLGPLGFEILEAENGEIALRKAVTNPPDAFLMDLVMPVMDGFQATREIRSTELLKDAVVIALSASVFERSRQDSMEAGCHDFVSKPVRADRLLDKLGMHLGLTWLYQDPDDQTKLPVVAFEPSEARIVAPRGPHAKVVHEHALRGDIGGIHRQLKIMDQLGEEYRPFVAALRRMAQDYDMRQINEFVEPFLGDGEGEDHKE
ncbi:MAG: response regulator, partial [Acidimicrobiia bacterium]|nr:response regulator [Acidimicrobiia bacterium]